MAGLSKRPRSRTFCPLSGSSDLNKQNFLFEATELVWQQNGATFFDNTSKLVNANNRNTKRLLLLSLLTVVLFCSALTVHSCRFEGQLAPTAD